MTEYYRDDQIALHHGDALAVAGELAAGAADCIVTSPPYYGLRDYGTEGQYGLESSPAEYVERLRELFGDLHRVLADDGTLWLNLGDSYAGSWGNQGHLIDRPDFHTKDLDEPSTAPRAQDAVRHTCEVCGRTGSRRFVETETGWRCAPSATKCPGNKQPDPAPVPVVAPVAAVHDERPVALAAGITAKCQDCTRTWTLTGRVLRSAVEMHEQKHSHFVDVADGATDG
nr:DNA methyltransferase [Mycobacterium sp.]